jgi:cytochrome c heme-lyase
MGAQQSFQPRSNNICNMRHENAQAAVSPLAAKGGCPIAHDQRQKMIEAQQTQTQSNALQQQHSASTVISSQSQAVMKMSPLASGCPMAKRPGAPASDPSPVSEPSATASDSVAASTSADASAFHREPAAFAGLTPEGENIHGAAIPAAGRGNSEDGQHWLNPSANQLFRALHRKGKGIETQDVHSVSRVHEAVTEHTWNCIMEYESLHAQQCSNPTLSQFYGMDGIYSAKAKWLNRLAGTPLPFDRHDWIVDRCGQKQVKYVIDYYSSVETNPETGVDDVAYFIDARPAPNTIGNIWDRMRMAQRSWQKGEKWY